MSYRQNSETVGEYLLRVFPPLVDVDTMSERDVGQYLAEIRSACRDYYKPKPKLRQAVSYDSILDPDYMLEAITKLKYRMLTEYVPDGTWESPYKREKVQMVIMDEVSSWEDTMYIRPKKQNIDLGAGKNPMAMKTIRKFQR